ncbi:MAG: hypothetical protein AAFY28_16710 [Actinomycetota bacterium]
MDSVGEGSLGVTTSAEEPWLINRFDTEFEDRTIAVYFSPPDTPCYAARGEAVAGRGDAVLLNLYLDQSGGPSCVEPSDNVVFVELHSPLDERRVYTTTLLRTSGASADAERVADELVGMMSDEAETLVTEQGFEFRDLTDVEVVQLVPNYSRISVWTEEDKVVFAEVS